ncbi:unnamed protein product [Penicillium roqueforti FM164]|uniref:Uncharacterized protein n=1 Tax=Penicillium roqueforti (strain FM164) TaxID=1365484 RepID=W6R6Q6_PENRF|nr:unnamed protein product [Penicillium roqueforti FM164]
MALYVKQGAAGAYIKGATIILTGYLFRASLFRIE